VRLADLEGVADAAAPDGVHVELTVDGDGDCLPAPVQAAVVRIVQEGLANVVKHSAATRAEVEVAVEQEVTVRVLDRGPARPIDPTARTGSGLGIVGMRERAALLGGTLHAGPAAGGGYLVEARLPARFPA
jgi:signal transduction histidine kinase